MARIKVFDTTTQSWVYADKSFGKDGESITITNIVESSEDKGNNVVTFSDGNVLNITNGSKGDKGDKPEKYVDYWTDADQEAMVQQVITALGTPVFGTVDLDKVINLNIDHLVDGTYTLGYENKDGKFVKIATITKEPEPTYTNLLPLAINSDGTPYNGDKGWKTGYRLNGSAVETAAEGIEVTGFIPAAMGDYIFLRNIDWPANGTNQTRYYISLYDSAFSKLDSKNMSNLDVTTAITRGCAAVDANNNVVMFKINNGLFTTINTWSKTAYVRISAQEITDDSVITVNENVTDIDNIIMLKWTDGLGIDADTGMVVNSTEAITDHVHLDGAESYSVYCSDSRYSGSKAYYYAEDGTYLGSQRLNEWIEGGGTQVHETHALEVPDGANTVRLEISYASGKAEESAARYSLVKE